MTAGKLPAAGPPLTPNAWLRFDGISRALRGLAAGSDVLEIGAGQGALGTRIATRHRYVGVESDPSSAERARQRVEAAGGELHQGFYQQVLGAGQRFDAVCAFEVLEHLEDDEAALADWSGLLRPGGRLVLSVPAHAHRMGPADTLVGHFRRYGREALVARLRQAGFNDVTVLSYGFPIGYGLEVLRNLLARRRLGSDVGAIEDRTSASGRLFQPPSAFAWLTWLVMLPFRFIQRPFRSTRFGTGLVAMAVRPR